VNKSGSQTDILTDQQTSGGAEVQRPRTWQKPKADHPWRRYTNKKLEVEVDIEIEKRTIIPVKQYLVQLLEGWDRIEIPMEGSMGIRRHYLRDLPQSVAAAYIAGVLKKYYVQKQANSF